MRIEKITQSVSETKGLAKNIGESLDEAVLFLLSGDLGAGKTAFTQGLALGLDIERTVSSPTFTLHKIYQGRMMLNHLDLYRMEGIRQDLGFEEVFDQGITVIEWPEYADFNLPDKWVKVMIEWLDENSRKLTFETEDEALGRMIERC